MNQLLDQHRFAHAGAPEQADFSPFGIRRQKVDDLDAGFQHLLGRFPLGVGGGGAVDTAPGRVSGHRIAAVNGLAEHVEHAAQHRVAHGHRNRCAGGHHLKIAAKPLAGAEHDATHTAGADMLNHLHHTDFSVQVHIQLFADPRQAALFELYVHHRSAHADNPSRVALPCRIFFPLASALSLGFGFDFIFCAFFCFFAFFLVLVFARTYARAFHDFFFRFHGRHAIFPPFAVVSRKPLPSRHRSAFCAAGRLRPTQSPSFHA